MNVREEVLDLLARGHLKPGMCYDMSKLSPSGQSKVLQAIAREGLNATEVNKLCHRVYAEENQADMMPETLVSEEHRQAVRTFAEAFNRISATLNRLHRLEEQTPGLLEEALATESVLVESQVDEAVRGLSRIKSVLQNVRMRRLAQAGSPSAVSADGYAET